MKKGINLIFALFLFCTCNLEKIDDETGGNCPTPPTAAFTPDKTTCTPPCTVVFTNNSTGAATYSWDFGDASSGSLTASPSHTFNTAGLYEVRLIATATNGCKDTTMTSVNISNSGGNCTPVAAFAITNGGCIAPCQVVFTNNSTDATAFEWDFGDGTPKVTQANPSHTYDLPGDYLITLKAICGTMEDMETKTTLVNAVKFTKTFGGTTLNETAYWVEQTNDGGYIIAGETSTDPDVNSQVYLIKTNAVGTIVWEQKHGDQFNYHESARCVALTSEGGYITAGTLIDPDGLSDMHVVKTNSTGNIVWSKNYGDGQDKDGLSGVVQTSDGGFVFVGYRYDAVMYAFKTDNAGVLVWEKTYPVGGPYFSSGYSISKTDDGGFVMSGINYEWSGQFGSDAYFLKIDASGNLVWSKRISGITDSENSAYGIQQTTDGGYIFTGFSSVEGLVLVKTDNAGNVTWQRNYSSVSGGAGYSVQQTADGGFVIAGTTVSNGADIDIFLIKTNETGILSWNKTFGSQGTDRAYCVRQTADGGYVIAGSYLSGAGNLDAYLIKTDKDGKAQ